MPICTRFSFTMPLVPLLSLLVPFFTFYFFFLALILALAILGDHQFPETVLPPDSHTICSCQYLLHNLCIILWRSGLLKS